MRIVCPYCGTNIDCDGTSIPSFCSNCGGDLRSAAPVSKGAEFEDPFAEKPTAAADFVDPFVAESPKPTQPVYGFAHATPNYFAPEPTGISSKLGNAVANKRIKSIRSMSIAVLVICVLRFVFSFVSYTSIAEIEELIPNLEPYYATVIQGYVDIFYAEIGIIFALFAVSIAVMVYANKLAAYSFPAKDDGVFSISRSTGIAAAVCVAFFILFFIVEIVGFVRYAEVVRVFEIEESNITTYSSFVWSLLIFAGVLSVMIQSFSLSKSKA